MDLKLVERLVAAVLYEGYLLYPYRPSAVKNRQRWNFGVLYPVAYTQAQRGTDAASMQTECLVHTEPATAIEVRVRFLHPLARKVAQLAAGSTSLAESDQLRPVESLEIDGQLYQSWQEAVEREVALDQLKLADLLRQPRQLAFSFPASRALEPLTDSQGRTLGAIIRQHETVEGTVEVAATQVDDELIRLTVRIANTSPFAPAGEQSRDDALLRSLASTHTILSIAQGEFVSLLEPPAHWQAAAAECRNVGAWPVLVGEAGEHDCLLSSPIILYDYPKVAPESAGDLFDATEIDEILTLRIMTLTDEEKHEVRQGDERARQLLERTETLPPEYLMRLHGTVRGLRPVEDEPQSTTAP